MPGREINGSGVWVWADHPQNIRIRLPLPPLINRRPADPFQKAHSKAATGIAFPSSIMPILILTKAAKDYMELVTPALRQVSRVLNSKPIDELKTFHVWWKVSRVEYDCHNGGKLVFSALQFGQIVAHDRFVMPWMRGVEHKPDDPHVAIEFNPLVTSENLG